MYEELVERLRAQADAERYFVGESMLYDVAADAIEKLSYKYQKALDDLVKQAYPPKEET